MFAAFCHICQARSLRACCFGASFAAALLPACLHAQVVGGLAAVTVSTTGRSAAEVVPSVSTRGEWLLAETPNFRVWTRFDRQQSIALAKRCEQVRNEIQVRWLPQTGLAPWNPKADVIVYPAADEYRRALGRASDGSSGCMTVSVDHGRVVERRIELRSDAAGWSSSSLPHEMTHVVLADRFPGRRLPRWADEGMAVLAESQAKQSERRRAAEQSRRSLGPLSFAQVMGLEDYPAHNRHAEFYAQSAALVEALVARGGPEQFLAFLDAAMRDGNPRALKAVYGLDGLSALAARSDGDAHHAAPVK